jgi:hypothetical protein
MKNAVKVNKSELGIDYGSRCSVAEKGTHL